MKAPKPLKQMIVAGLMSGTSADGADVALVRVTARAPTRRTRRGPKAHPGPTSPKLHLLGFASFPYPRRLGQAVLAAMDAQSISTAELARLHWRLGQFYGDSVRQAQEQLGYRAVLVGVHGQTMYHQGQPAKYLGTPLRCTWQIGEASEVAARTQLPVVSDFRPADMVAGGQAAPLVSIFDRIYFAHPKRNRVLQNLGGIANMSAIPAGSHDMIAFDSGPASVIMDACMKALFKRPYDRGGATARRGKPLQQVLDRLLQLPYFKALPPKSCGREEFGGDFVVRFIEQCRALNATSPDVVATATAFTAETILHAYRTFVWPFLGQHAPLARGTDYIVAGGGANNTALMTMLRAGLEPLGVTVATTDHHGVPTQAKEAMAFALLSWLRWHGIPGNVPSATGASRPAILGRVTLP